MCTFTSGCGILRQAHITQGTCSTLVIWGTYVSALLAASLMLLMQCTNLSIIEAKEASMWCLAMLLVAVADVYLPGACACQCNSHLQAFTCLCGWEQLGDG